MVSLTSLTLELLLEIFHRLDSTGLARIKRVCKAFHAIAEDVPYKLLIFKVDHEDHSAWKLTRTLLQNPKVAEQFEHIVVEWHRRKDTDPDTWTIKWEWTDEERKKLEELRDSPDLQLKPETITAILEGINSEAALPLLLLHTKNLENLDIGDTQLQLIISEANNSDRQWNAFCEVTEHKMTEDEEETVEAGDTWDLYDQHSRKHVPNQEHLTWFNLNVAAIDHPDKIPLGLRNIKHLRHGYDDSVFASEYIYGIEATSIAPLFFLPKLETMEVVGCATARMGYSDPMILDPFDGFKSTVKRLNFIDARMFYDDFTDLAQYTGSLESVAIENSDTYSYLQGENEIIEAFMEHNKGLTLSDITLQNKTGDHWISEE